MALAIQNLIGPALAPLLGGAHAPGGQGAPSCPCQQQGQMESLQAALVMLLLGLLMNGGLGGGQSPGGQAPGGGAFSGGAPSPVGASSSGGGAPNFGGRSHDQGPSSAGSAPSALPLTRSQPNPSGYAFPVQGFNGDIPLHHGSHPGAADLFAPRGTPVVSMSDGVVTSTGTGGAGGNSVTIKDDQGLMYYYAHLNEAPQVQQGQRVTAGQPIGTVGDSGNAAGTGTHLHLGIGESIISGTGPSGGAGSNFNANEFLRNVLQGG